MSGEGNYNFNGTLGLGNGVQNYSSGEFMSMVDGSMNTHANNLNSGPIVGLSRTINRVNPLNSASMGYTNNAYQGAQLSASGVIGSTRMINNNYSGQGFGSTYDTSYSNSGYIQYNN